MKIFEKIKPEKRKKSGVIAGEVLIGSTLIITLLVLFISYFAYIYPKSQVDMKLQSFAESVSIQGKVTESALINFENELKAQGYKKSDLFPAGQTKQTGLNVYGYVPDPQGDIIVRDNLIDTPTSKKNPFGRDQGYIRITLVLPAKGASLNHASRLFGVVTGKEMETYVFSKSILSQKYVAE